MGDTGSSKRLWLEEELQSDLRWQFLVKSIMFTGRSKFQDVELIDTGPFGKVLLLDGKVQSAEADERVYHECLVHPAMLHHHNPKSVFIMGGGEGATAREVLRHKSVEQCVMVDIDQVVCDFCEEHLEANKAAFADARLQLVVDDARSQLENWPGTFDVIIGDLADPVYGGPCYQLYTQEFYSTVVKAKLNPGGIFVTQSGPAGVMSASQVFSAINHTLASVFPAVVPYAQHLPSFADCWGWNIAFTDPSQTQLVSAEEIDQRISERVSGELEFLDGATLLSVAALNKIVRKVVANESHIFTVDNPRYIFGEGYKTLV